MVRSILRLEDLLVFIASVYFYYILNGNLLLFFLLLLLVDISMVGYLKDKKFGSITYNLFHNYFLGLILILMGVMSGNNMLISAGLIFTAHVGMDRGLVGVGLKYPTDFKHTHLQKL